MFETFLEDIAAAGGKELLDAVEAEFRKGWHAQQALVEAQLHRVSAVCNQMESSAVDGMGRVESDIPADVYFYWLEKERRSHNVPNTWADRDFRRRFLRDHPQCKVKYRRKPMVGGFGLSNLQRAKTEGEAARSQRVILT